MSSLVTWVPGLHSPWASVPGWHACVNAPTTTTSPLTYAVSYTSDWQLFPPLPNQVLLHWVWPTVVPAETFGVNATGPWPTRLVSCGEEASAALMPMVVVTAARKAMAMRRKRMESPIPDQVQSDAGVLARPGPHLSRRVGGRNPL